MWMDLYKHQQVCEGSTCLRPWLAEMPSEQVNQRSGWPPGNWAIIHVFMHLQWTITLKAWQENLSNVKCSTSVDNHLWIPTWNATGCLQQRRNFKRKFSFKAECVSSVKRWSVKNLKLFLSTLVKRLNSFQGWWNQPWESWVHLLPTGNRRWNIQFSGAENVPNTVFIMTKTSPKRHTRPSWIHSDIGLKTFLQYLSNFRRNLRFLDRNYTARVSPTHQQQRCKSICGQKKNACIANEVQRCHKNKAIIHDKCMKLLFLMSQSLLEWKQWSLRSISSDAAVYAHLFGQLTWVQL